MEYSHVLTENVDVACDSSFLCTKEFIYFHQRPCQVNSLLYWNQSRQCHEYKSISELGDMKENVGWKK